jgi:hypothetical protein
MRRRARQGHNGNRSTALTTLPTQPHSRGALAALIVMIFGAVTWLGSYNARMLIGLDLLQFGTLEFRYNIHPYVERTTFAMISQTGILALIAYPITWVASVIYLRLSPLRLKEHGWLMMSALLFFVFTPVEVYTAILDIKLWLLNASGSNDLVEFRKLFIHRLGALSGVPIIGLLCYYTIIVLAVVRPMRKPSPVSTPTGLN